MYACVYLRMYVSLQGLCLSMSIGYHECTYYMHQAYTHAYALITYHVHAWLVFKYMCIVCIQMCICYHFLHVLVYT